MEEEQSEGEKKQEDREEHWWTDYQVQDKDRRPCFKGTVA
jgi:hypothetical protein